MMRYINKWVLTDLQKMANILISINAILNIFIISPIRLD
jgi:hypothetical protein